MSFNSSFVFFFICWDVGLEPDRISMPVTPSSLQPHFWQSLWPLSGMVVLPMGQQDSCLAACMGKPQDRMNMLKDKSWPVLCRRWSVWIRTAVLRKRLSLSMLETQIRMDIIQPTFSTRTPSPHQIRRCKGGLSGGSLP